MLDQAQVSHRLKIAQKIPFLKDLSADQVNRVLNSGKLGSMDAGNRLCKAGEHSNAMWVLLGGELLIKDGETILATLEAVDLAGEMSLITGLPRSATILVTKDAVLLEIQKLRLDALLKDDIDLERKLYRNMLQSLCGKLRQNNAQMTQEGTTL
tara:strand:- start:194 stop:655 length:462 start_codon:yes stop_codon:yes gene_type:complete